MYNQVVNFPAKTKAPLYVRMSVDSGTIVTNGQATYIISDWTGAPIGSGAVSVLTDSALQITELTGLDGVALSLLPGTYVVEFLLPVLAGTDPRQYVYTIVLNVPGVRAYDHYPTAADLQVFLVAARMLTNPPAGDDLFLDLDSAVQNAVNTWEQATGYVPFLAGPDDTTRPYFPQDLQQGGGGGYGSGYGFGYGGGFGGMGGYGGTLPLRAGLLSLTSVTAAGQTFTPSGTPPIRLLPDTAPSRNRPYEELQFCGTVPWGPVGSTIDVLGRWGFAAALPPDVWSVLLGLAGGEIAPGLSLAVTGGLNSYTEAGITETVRSSPFGDALARWQAQTGAALRRYKRYSIA